MTDDGPGDELGPRSNALQHLRRLSGRRRARRDAGQFVIDGPTLIGEALASPVEVVEVYAEPAAPDDVVAAAVAAGVPVRTVAAGALERVTSPVSPQPVAALAAIHRRPRRRLPCTAWSWCWSECAIRAMGAPSTCRRSGRSLGGSVLR